MDGPPTAALTNGPFSGRYRVADGALPASGYSISRADVADFMISEAEAPADVHKIVGLARESIPRQASHQRWRRMESSSLGSVSCSLPTSS